MQMNKITLIRILTIILLIVALLVFFFHNKIGIRLGYLMNGGGREVDSNKMNPDVILHEYYYQVDTYDRYRGSDNPTAQKWAEAAKEKANAMASQYNDLMGEFILNNIG